MLVVIRGAGDIASGIALRLIAAQFEVAMLDCAVPTAIRRTVSFSEAIRLGETYVEGVRGVLVEDCGKAREVAASGLEVPVLVDPEGSSIRFFEPDVVVDAILAKRNLGTTLAMAPIVLGVGPGFTVRVDCHAAIETMRGHNLGRVLYEGSPSRNTGIPGSIGGFTVERVLRAPTAGIFRPVLEIGDAVEAGNAVAYVGDTPIISEIGGVVRGVLQEGVSIPQGMKVADVDPRGMPEYCQFSSDKARAIGGGVLEAIMHFSNRR